MDLHVSIVLAVKLINRVRGVLFWFRKLDSHQLPSDYKSDALLNELLHVSIPLAIKL